MPLRQVGNSSLLRRILSGAAGGFANASTLQALLGQQGGGDEVDPLQALLGQGGEEAFPVMQEGTVPEDPFGVAIDSGQLGQEGGDESFEELIRRLLQNMPIGGAGGQGGIGGF